jgi:hypothetical protein
VPSLFPLIHIVTYRGFYSRWQCIYVPKSQHTAVQYNQPFSKHTSGVYTQRCPTQESFYRTSSGNLSTRTHILAVSKSPNTGARPASTFFGHKLSFLQSVSFQTHVLLSKFPNNNSVFQTNESVAKHARLHSAISKHGLTTNQKSVDNSLVTMEPNYSLFTLLRNNWK